MNGKYNESERDFSRSKTLSHLALPLFYDWYMNPMDDMNNATNLSLNHFESNAFCIQMVYEYICVFINKGTFGFSSVQIYTQKFRLDLQKSRFNTGNQMSNFRGLI